MPNDFSTINDNGWITTNTESDNLIEWDWLKFLTGIELGNEKEDSQIVYAGDQVVSTGRTNNILAQTGLSVFPGVVSALDGSVTNSHIQFIFQQKGDNKRVIITVGYAGAEDLFLRYADDIPHSVFWAQAGSPIGYAVISSAMEEKYKSLTGKNDTHWHEIWDAQVTTDRRHRETSETSFLWFNSEGKLMEKPLVFPNDKVQIGVLSGFLGFGFTPRVDVDISQSKPAPQTYQELFNKALSRFNR